MKAEVAVAPVQRPSLVGSAVAQSCDREAGPLWPEVFSPGRSPFDDRQVSWCNFAFDADLVQCVLGHSRSAPSLHSRDI